MNTNIDIQDFQDELNILSSEMNATEAFLSTLWDKADFFEKLCEEASVKLTRAQKRCKELQALVEKKAD